MKQHSLIGIDLAKTVFQACILSSDQRVILNQSFNRNTLKTFILQQPPTTIAMEACYSSHYWARLFQSWGHQVKLLPAQHVKPFVRGNKNDHNDALAIAEAAQRPGIRTVPIKTLEQQDIQTLHRLRERYVRQRTALTNQTRGLLSEYGIVFPQGFKSFKQALASLLEPENTQLSDVIKQHVDSLFMEFDMLCLRLEEINRSLSEIVKRSPDCQRLMSIPGIGIVNATALYSAIGRGQQFKNAREFAVWLGITPKQFASGGKSMMAGITKRGDRYLRKQLIHGARAAMTRSKNRGDKLSQWLSQVIARRGQNKACVALAHRMARLCWTLLKKQEMYHA